MREHELFEEMKYDTAGAAKLLGISARTLQKYAKSGRIRSFKIGNRFLFTESMLSEFAKSCEANTETPDTEHTASEDTAAIAYKPKYIKLN